VCGGTGDDADADDGDWRAALAEAGRLTGPAVDALMSAHGARGRRAIEAVSEERVKRYRDFTVVVGHAEEYVVEDGACTCKDSEYNLDPADPDQLCWHAIAVAVADRVGAVDHHDMWYSDVREFV
jgi:predicted nucleic acid-binding Zn finger protein